MLDILKKKTQEQASKSGIQLPGRMSFPCKLKMPFCLMENYFKKKKIGILTNKGNLLTLNNLL